MKWKRIAALVLCAVLSFSLFPLPANADGSGNMDHGGGSGMGGGSDSSYWNGDDGIRITIVRSSDNEPVSRPIDITNYDEANVTNSFIAKSKLHYRAGSSLQINHQKYVSIKPKQSMPKIIVSVGMTNISAIRSYFTDRQVIISIAHNAGTTYEKLTDGNYKLLLEPIAYFYFQGYKYAMTATEAALYDEALSGGLRAEMVSLTNQQLPLSMFLEHADLGYPAFHGNRTRRQSDDMIISQLGLGIVKFKNEPGNPETDDTEYRCNTDVITSVTLSTEKELNPTNAASVTFHILGGNFTVSNIVMPAGENQLVWVKWHTPDTPQTVDISITASKGSLSADEIAAKVSDLTEKTPPNPTATDRDDNFQAVAAPNKSAVSASSWSVWSAYWVPNWIWISNWVWVSNPSWASGGKWVDEGTWEDEGKYAFRNDSYHASLSATMSLMPDDKDPTAKGKLMKSGYGIKINVPTGMSTSVQSWVTGAQTAVTYFPEFQYKNYWRILDRMTDGLSADFMFKTNEFSTYNRRVHFTPVWYPDSTYTAYTYLEDAWTPAGMLSANLTDYVTIRGSVYDDWHIGPKMVN